MVFNDFEHILVLILGSEHANPVPMATQSIRENVNIPINQVYMNLWHNIDLAW